MSAAALFTTEPTGRPFIPVIVNLADIPRSKQFAAWKVYSAVVDCLYKGKTETSEAVTDKFLQKNTWLKGFSLRFIQKGLKALELAGLIRRTHRYGTRRRIYVLGRLKGRPRPSSKAKGQAEAKGTKPGKPAATPNVARPHTPATQDQQDAADRKHAETAALNAQVGEPIPAGYKWDWRKESAELREKLADSSVPPQPKAPTPASKPEPDPAPADNPEPAPSPRLRVATPPEPDRAEIHRQLQARQHARLARLEAIPAELRTPEQERERILTRAAILEAIPPAERTADQQEELRALGAQFKKLANRSP
jgi:hypothetical protein